MRRSLRIIVALSVLLALAVTGTLTIGKARGGTGRSNPPASVAGVSEPLPLRAGEPRFAPAVAYVHFGWGNPPDPVNLMKKTGLRWFAVSFVNAKGGCNPAWDGERPLRGSVEAAAISRIRAAGGDVMVTFGGWDGTKLSQACATPTRLAAAYQKVIDTYRLKAIDLNVENKESQVPAYRDRLIDALKILKSRRPNVHLSITTTSAPRTGYRVGEGLAMVRRAAAIGLRVDTWQIMPFNLTTNPSADSVAATMRNSFSLRAQLREAFRVAEPQARAMQGVVVMIGKDDFGVPTDVAKFNRILEYARSRHLGRLSIWSANRDRACTRAIAPYCSGVKQDPYIFSRRAATFTG